MGKTKPASNRAVRRRWVEQHFMLLLYGILAGAALIYSLRNPQYRTGSFNDDAIFVIGARDFWRGAAMRSHLLKPDYPCPGLPLLLSPLAKLVFPHWTLLESVTIVFTVFLVYLMGLLSRKLLPPGEALAVTALLAFNPVVARLSGSVMSEIYYAVAIIISYVLLSEELEKPTLKKALGLGFIVGWGCLVRPEGGILLISILVPVVLRQKGRRFLLAMLIPLTVWGVFAFYWFRIRTFPGSEYGSDLNALTSYWAHHFTSGLQFLNDLLQDFLNHPLLSTKITAHLSRAINGALMVICMGIMGIGFRSLWKQRTGERAILIGAGIFCGLYFIVHLFWHAKAPRYSIPMLPFILVFLIRGTNAALSPLKQRRRWTQVAFAVLLLFDFYRNGLAIRQTYVSGPKPINVPPWRSLAWLRDHTPSDAVVMSNIAPTINLYTERPATNGIYSNNFEWLSYRFMKEHMDFLVLRAGDFLTPGVSGAQDPNQIWNRLRLWAAHYPQRFQLLYTDPVEQTVIYRVVSDPQYVHAYDLFKMGVAYYRADRSDPNERALRTFQKCVATYPKLGSAYNFLGAIYMNRQDFMHAQRAFATAIALLPDDPYAMLNMATLYRMGNQPDQAQAYVQRALDVSAANGEEDVWKANVNELYQEWDQKHARMFLDAPLS